MISLLHTGSQDTAETQHEEEVAQEELIALQSNLPMSPPGQSHFLTEATLEEDGYDSDKRNQSNEHNNQRRLNGRR